MQHNLAIEMRHITKSFGDIKANDDINLEVIPGEVHALLGENGAGKTTLMNMLSGIYTPDSGEILINGEPVTFHSPADSIRLGIGMIHQHFKLVDVMTAKENIVIGQPSSFFTKGRELAKKVKELSDKYGLDIDPNKKVYDMSVGEKQTLEIIKVLYRGAKILILDEPTNHLDPDTQAIIGENFRDYTGTIMLVSHNPDFVEQIGITRMLVLPDGKIMDYSRELLSYYYILNTDML